MTTKKRPSGQQLGMVKLLVVVGGMTASLVGTRLLAVNDAQTTAVTNGTAVTNQTTITTAQPATIINNPAPAQQGNGSLQLDLPPIPQAISPAVQPVARTRSSR